MDLTIIRMIALEREMELRRQVARKARYARDDFPSPEPESHKESLKNLLDRLPRLRRSRPQPVCECSQAACR